MTSTSVMIVESDAAWPASELARAEPGADCIVVVQQTGESELAFARRTIARIRTLVEQGSSVRLGVISVGKSAAPAAIDSRYRIARALVAARSGDAGVELALVASEGSRPRHDLMALAGALCEASANELVVRVKMLPCSTDGHDAEAPSGRAA